MIGLLLTTPVVSTHSHALSLLIGWVALALCVSFLCSLLEATLLTARLPELQARQTAGDRGAGILLDLKEKRLGDAISAILILNTCANTVGATMAGRQAQVLWQEPAVSIFAALFTLSVLIGTEIIPKTLGTSYASGLARFAGFAITLMIRATRPLLVVTKGITNLLAHGRADEVSRGELTALVAMAVRSGTLEAHESKALHNLLRLENVLVEDVMTPRTVVKMLPTTTTVDQLLADEEATMYSRIPLSEGTKDEVIGYIVQRQVIVDAIRTGRRDRPLSKWLRKLRFIPENADLAQALKLFLEAGEHLLMVADEYGGVSGLVTLEDVLETILGAEIMDETDRVEDLRTSAAELRDRRLRRHQQFLDELRQHQADDEADEQGVVREMRPL